jgi:hypothetical protein
LTIGYSNMKKPKKILQILNGTWSASINQVHEETYLTQHSSECKRLWVEESLLHNLKQDFNTVSESENQPASLKKPPAK